MKLITMSAALLLTLSTMSLSAQPQPKGRPNRAGERPSAEKIAEFKTDRLDQALDLTDAQEKNIYAVNLKYAEQQQAKRPTRGTGVKGEKLSDEQRAAKREAMAAQCQAAQATKKAYTTEIMSLLTEDQKVEYAMILAKSKQQSRPQNCRKAQPGQGQSKGKRPSDNRGRRK